MAKIILSIIIPVFNKWGFTKQALKDLYRLPNNHEIIVLDNGSSDETQSQLQNSKEIIYVRNNNNFGFAKASNQGYQISSAPNILFLNNDIRVNHEKINSANWTLS